MSNMYNFQCAMEHEYDRAVKLFPGTEDMAMALMEEVGELAQALIQQKSEPQKGVTHEDIWKEAVQVAVMAARIAIQGQEGFPYHPESGYRGRNWDGYVEVSNG